jgi:glycosyltransferase involved in cell wall biosynthesis
VRVYLVGQDRPGWSVDRDRESTRRALEASGHRVIRTSALADVVYCVWWNVLLGRRNRRLRRKPLVAVVTNDLAHQLDELRSVLAGVDVWVVANSLQRAVLLEEGVPGADIVQSPFYVEEDVFLPFSGSREEAARLAGVDPEQVRGRFVVGSFQRDSLGADLSRPKWQKGPELLAEVMERVAPDDALLLLAGPRRHWLLERCRERSIPYLFVGREPAPGSRADDIDLNTLPIERINALWGLCDAYIVSSASEGGPKAVLEAGLTETPVASTRVGMATDLVPDSMLFDDADSGAALLRRLMRDGGGADFRAFIERVREVDSFEAYRARVDAAVRAAAGR